MSPRNHLRCSHLGAHRHIGTLPAYSFYGGPPVNPALVATGSAFGVVSTEEVFEGAALFAADPTAMAAAAWRHLNFYRRQLDHASQANVTIQSSNGSK